MGINRVRSRHRVRASGQTAGSSANMRGYKKMPIADRVGYLLALGNVIALLFFLPRVRCQNLPTKDEDKQHIICGKYRPEIVFDTHVLPDGREVTVYLLRNVSQKWFVAVEEDGTPLSITVTPCASLVSWSVIKKPLLDIRRKENKRSRDRVLDKVFKEQLSNPKSLLLGNFTGEGTRSYEENGATVGLYVITIEAHNSDSLVKFYVSTTPEFDRSYPPLPANRNVTLVNKSKRTIEVEWEKAPVTGNLSVSYCISISKIKNFRTQCSVLSHLLGDSKPRLPKDSGFLFDWEKEKFREFRRRAKPIKAARKGEIFYTCIGGKTSYTFREAKPGKIYYVNVFVINKANNMSAAYSGLRVRTGRRKVYLQDGQRQTVNVRGKKRQQLVVFQVKEWLSEALLEFKSCRGKLNFEIYHRKIPIHKSSLRRRKILKMKNVPAGVYTIRLYGRRKRRNSVMLYFTTRPSKYKGPRLPKDRRIKVFDNLTTCSNVTLAWLGTNVKQRYCLYKSKVSETRSLKRLRCREPEDRRKDKVVCKRFRSKRGDKAVVKEVVQNLKPNTEYVFDVYVSRGRGTTLTYQSVVTRTKAQC